MAKLFVICGHGAGDPGAIGNGFTEAERVRVLGKRIKELGGANVMLGDVNRNYYADNGIGALNIPKDYQIVELHMDSATPGARGAHVIILGGYTADEYDNKLASFITGLMPGRAKAIVGRTDLANPHRAASKGYGYRLVECGFITNAEDVRIFNSNIDKIAKGILASFGIGSTVVSPTPSKPAPAPSPSPAPSALKDLGKVNIMLQGFTRQWWPEVVNDSDWVGEGDGSPLTYLAVKVDKGTITGRVYTEKNGWLPKLTFGNTNNLLDMENGVLGDGSPIQAVELYYNTPSGYKYKYVKYCVSDIHHNTFYPNQIDNETGNGMDGYAGVIGVAVDKLKAVIV